MNKYGKFAQETWKMTAPSQYSLIPDPEEWFRKLGEEAATRVEELTREIAGPDSMTDSFLEKYGRLTTSQMQAEEIVRAEMLTPSEMETEGDETDDEEKTSSILLEHRKEMSRILQEGMEEVRAEELAYQDARNNPQN
ncbi:hypothetical protein IWX65_002670 [Arthrobacter sp. CAN_A214]|uniref:TnpV protein n=1 Tax=Arthrobacter sp. CAN_A214 TaxID=2787720 RepID=UPI001A2EFA2E